MWAWIMDELQKAVKALPINSALVNIDEDDIVQNVVLQLFNAPDLAKDIYDNHKIGLLYTIVKREIYGNYGRESKMVFENKMELSRFQRIIAVCKKYNIAPKPENAYKIFALLEDGSNNFTIAGIVNLLTNAPIEDGALIPKGF